MTITISGFGLLILLLALTAPEVLLFPFAAAWALWDLARSFVVAIWDLTVDVAKAVWKMICGTNGKGES